MKPAQLKTLQMIWAIFLVSPGMHAYVLRLKLSTPAEVFPGVSPLPFQIVAVVLALFTLLIWRGGLAPQNLRKAGTTEDKLTARWFTTHLLLFILAESISLVGLMLGFICQEITLAYPLMATSALLVGIMYPSPATLDAAIKQRDPQVK